MNSKTYGYIRVSSREQNDDRQRIALRDAGVLSFVGLDLILPKQQPPLRKHNCFRSGGDALFEQVHQWMSAWYS